MGSTQSNDFVNLQVITTNYNNITINDNNTITITNILFDNTVQPNITLHFYPDIKKICLDFLKKCKLYQCTIQFLYYEQTIFGINYYGSNNKDFRASRHLSKVVISGLNYYYIDKKSI